MINGLCACSVTQLCPGLCIPTDCRAPGFSVHGILQEMILERAAISSSIISSPFRDQTHISCDSYIGRQILYHHTTWEALLTLTQIGRQLPNNSLYQHLFPCLGHSLNLEDLLSILWIWKWQNMLKETKKQNIHTTRVHSTNLSYFTYFAFVHYLLMPHSSIMHAFSTSKNKDSINFHKQITFLTDFSVPAHLECQAKFVFLIVWRKEFEELDLKYDMIKAMC